jgi:hypothetical protein
MCENPITKYKLHTNNTKSNSSHIYVGKMKLKIETGSKKKRSKKAILLEMHFLPLCVHKHDAKITFRVVERTT